MQFQQNVIEKEKGRERIICLSSFSVAYACKQYLLQGHENSLLPSRKHGHVLVQFSPLPTIKRKREM